MKVTYDQQTDTLTVRFKPGPAAESDEEKPGIVLDYDDHGDLIGIEILDALRHVPDVMNLQFEVSPPPVN